MQVGPRQTERIEQVSRPAAREALDQDVGFPPIDGEARAEIPVHRARGSRIVGTRRNTLHPPVQQRREEVRESCLIAALSEGRLLARPGAESALTVT